jgi:hypothetical protein
LGGTDVDPAAPPAAADVPRLSDPAEEERDDELAGAFAPSREDEPEAVDVALDAPFGGVDVASFFTTVRFSARAFPATAFLLLRCEEAGDEDGRGIDLGMPFAVVDRSESDATDCEVDPSAGADDDATPLSDTLSLMLDSRDDVIDLPPRSDDIGPPPSLLAAAIALGPKVGASFGAVFSTARFSTGRAAPIGFNLPAALPGTSLLGAPAGDPAPKRSLFCGADGGGVRVSCFPS